ncbi:hypothetical protein MMC17_002935 [Xylographa soralifera]|nr:hypothetical protein [Xylographa soralifera]
MSDASGKTSGTRRRSGTIVPNCKEAPGPETTVPVTSSTSGPHVVVSPAKSPSSSSHFGTTQEFKLPYYLAERSIGMPQEPKHDTEEDLKAADAESVKVDRNTTVTTTKEKGKTLTDEKEKQAVDEAYKALMEEGFRPPSR